MASLAADLNKLTLRDVESSSQQEDPADNIEQEDEFSGSEIIISPFRFFDLPSEIRLKIYGFVLFSSGRKAAAQPSGNVGASSKNKPVAPLSQRLALFLASRRLHDEAAALFYSVQTFRVFPIQDYSRQPTLASLGISYRPMIKKIELILGSSWTAPPKLWRVTSRLGLAQMTGVKIFKIFIQCDPSHPVFEGFRISNNFYTDFAGDLVHQILEQLPNLGHVEFDAWPSVQKNGALMGRLLSEVRAAGKKIHWGPERGWNDWEDDELPVSTDVVQNDHITTNHHPGSTEVGPVPC